jgi:hypothetical protein
VICITQECQNTVGRFPRGFGSLGGPPTATGPCSVTPACTGSRLCFHGPDGRGNCLCVPPVETCNGVDDDCDGQIDEGGAVLCDDGLSCTHEACHGVGGCVSSSAMDVDSCRPAFCVYATCGDEEPLPGTAPALEGTLSAPDANGCRTAPANGWCEIWDGCACNGVSTCDPTAAAASGVPAYVATGCIEREAPSLWPCELVGDQDICSAEFCCEPNGDLCRYVHYGTSPGGSTILLPPDNELCTNSLVPHVNPNNSDYVQVACINDTSGFLSYSDRVILHCNETDPCTDDGCSRGACTHTPIEHESPEPLEVHPTIAGISLPPIPLDRGCTGDGTSRFGANLINHGCAVQRCEPLPRTPGATTCTILPTAGDAARFDCAGAVDECGYRECNAYPPYACDTLSDDSRCDDGVDCTIDVCIGSRCPNLHFPPDGIPPAIADGQCYIQFTTGAPRTCVAEGTRDPADENCELCRSAENQYSWSRENPSEHPECAPH